MSDNRKSALARSLKSASALLLIGLSLAGFARQAEAVDCDGALLRCLQDALSLAGEGSLFAGAAYAAFCLEGYAFCREYLR